MPRRETPRQHLSILLKVQFGGVFWTKFEHFLSKTPNKEASPAVARKPRHPAKKFSSHFLICARRFFSSKRKRKLLCGVLLFTSRTAGLSAFCIRSGVAEFPPNPPSATPSRGRFFFSAEFEAVPVENWRATRILCKNHLCRLFLRLGNHGFGFLAQIPCFIINRFHSCDNLFLRCLVWNRNQ